MWWWVLYAFNRASGTLRTHQLPDGRICQGYLDDFFHYALLLVFVLLIFSTRKLLLRVGELEVDYKRIRVSRDKSALDQDSALKQAIDFISLKFSERGAFGWYALCLVVSVLFVLIFQVLLPLILPSKRTSWSLSPGEYPLLFFVATVWSLFYMVLIVGNVMWYFTATGLQVFRVVRRAARSNLIKIVPNAPDGHGGVVSIGKVAFSLAAVGGCGMPLVIIWFLVFGVTWSGVLGGLLYGVIVTAPFFLALWSMHEAMKRAKKEELKRVSGLFALQYNSFFENASKGHQTELSNQLEIMAKLDSLYASIKSMPIWPFDLSTLSRLLLLLVPPIITVIFRLRIVDWISQWLNANGLSSLVDLFRAWADLIAK